MVAPLGTTIVPTATLNREFGKVSLRKASLFTTIVPTTTLNLEKWFVVKA